MNHSLPSSADHSDVYDGLFLLYTLESEFFHAKKAKKTVHFWAVDFTVSLTTGLTV